MKLALVLTAEELSALEYPVIVERWEQAVGRYACGRKKRKHHALFSEAERNTLSKYHALFHRWHLVTGTPEEFIFRKISTVELIRKAAAFFASI